MSSEASIEPRGLATLRPWQFFVLTGLVAATTGVLLSRGTEPRHIILISLTILASSLVGIAVYRTLWPLVSANVEGPPGMARGRARLALEREKMLVLRSIKELEFDRAMGKVSDGDFEVMTGRLRVRALGLIRQLDAGGPGYRELIEREIAARLGPARQTVASGRNDSTESGSTPGRSGQVRRVEALQCVCGTLNDLDARFCKACGERLAS